MKVVLLSVVSSKEDWFRDVVSIYEKKIGAFTPFEVRFVKPKKAPREDREHKKQIESEALLREIQSDDFVVLCDERGNLVNSVQFSKNFQNFLNTGKKRIVFVIGGPFGFAEEIKKRANWIWSLSSLVMNHLVVHVVLLEQIYRAYSILKNKPYHNE